LAPPFAAVLWGALFGGPLVFFFCPKVFRVTLPRPPPKIQRPILLSMLTYVDTQSIKRVGLLLPRYKLSVPNQFFTPHPRLIVGPVTPCLLSPHGLFPYPHHLSSQFEVSVPESLLCAQITPFQVNPPALPLKTPPRDPQPSPNFLGHQFFFPTPFKQGGRSLGFFRFPPPGLLDKTP